ncbi:MAG: hypothetical protein JSW34_10925 [Candidatus Zixiibacteriota bacterium]|nr:MAG: hypothetical protein JSW34_10925 [candidate division Zixibacteria bacterium]
MRGFTRDSIVQLLDRKTIWLFAVVTVIMVAALIVVGNARFQGGPHGEIEFDAREINEMLGNPMLSVFSSFVSFLVILTVLLTAGTIPVMLVPGRAEFYLSKPISRTAILLNRLWGIMVAYGLLIVICGLIGYATMYFVFSVSVSGIIYLFLLNLISLFIWLSITFFAGVALGSTSMAIVTAGLVWFAQWVLQARELIKGVVDSRALEITLNVMYFVLPNTGDLSDLTVKLASGARVADWAPLYTSLGFAIILMIVTLVIFNRKNY